MTLARSKRVPGPWTAEEVRQIPLRLVYERGEVLTEFSSAPCGNKYAQRRKMGAFVRCDALAVGSAEDQMIRSSPCLLYSFYGNHPRRLRYENRSRLRLALGPARPLVGRAMYRNQGQFVETITEPERLAIRSLDMDPVTFWRSCRTAQPVFRPRYEQLELGLAGQERDE